MTRPRPKAGNDLEALVGVGDTGSTVVASPAMRILHRMAIEGVVRTFSPIRISVGTRSQTPGRRESSVPVIGTRVMLQGRLSSANPMLMPGEAQDLTLGVPVAERNGFSMMCCTDRSRRHEAKS